MSLSIGDLSRQTGVKIPTIRYYEQAGLMPEPGRTNGRQRRYGNADADRLRFIRHARDLGFEVPTIRELLELGSRPEQPCEEVDRLARRHLQDVDRRITQLTALRGELQHMLDQCSHGRIGDCRVIQVLSDHGECDHADHGARTALS